MAMSNRYRITVDGVAYEVEFGDIEMSPVEVTVDGIGYIVEVPDLQRVDPTVATPPTPAARPAPRRPAERARPSPTAANDSQNVVRAPMPGRIVRVNVSTGDSVSRGQAVVVLESMKMENTIAAPRDGVISQVNVAADDSVQHGQSLVELE